MSESVRKRGLDVSKQWFRPCSAEKLPLGALWSAARAEASQRASWNPGRRVSQRDRPGLRRNINLRLLNTIGLVPSEVHPAARSLSKRIANGDCP
jgi:hypothetical protein